MNRVTSLKSIGFSDFIYLFAFFIILTLGYFTISNFLINFGSLDYFRSGTQFLFSFPNLVGF